MIIYYCNVILLAVGSLRLDDGTNTSSGSLIFQLGEGSWGTVCSNGFDWRAANVACKQLGYDFGDYTTW